MMDFYFCNGNGNLKNTNLLVRGRYIQLANDNDALRHQDPMREVIEN